MARRRNSVLSTAEPRIPEPVHSLDPTDWRMYCDLLQDAGEPEESWLRARRIAESLETEPRLVLINYCQAGPLNAYWLRVGQTWFIGAAGTYIEKNRLVWWRPQWVREGFERYPYNPERYPHRDMEALLLMNWGTPWEMPHPRWERLLKRRRGFERARRGFFEGHALAEMPENYR